MRIVVVSGHMTDQPDRTTPRFPESTVWRVRLETRRQFTRWGITAGDVLICGGARGADLIAADEARRLGAKVRLVLAEPEETFVPHSVAGAAPAWVDAFRSVREHADVVVIDPPGDGSIHEAANRRILDDAMVLDPAERFGLLVWNGATGDGPGGTADMAAEMKRQNMERYGIDPQPRRSADRQWQPGHKKLLALDGGGIRGILSLGILDHIEAQLRAVHGNDDLVLADFFDYIAGTSTGAIIATLLSKGLSVEEIRDKYKSLGGKVFKLDPRRLLVSLHASAPLLRELHEMLGDATLGDPELRTLLLVVMHRADSDSPWPLSNCPSAKYNRPERVLENGNDRNLDLSLAKVVRASTAAPLFFPPQDLKVGARTWSFQDGGVTPYNNPSSVLFTMATAPEYEVEWPTGDTNILLASIGTGSALAASHSKLILRRLPGLPGVFMNGSSYTQDLQCRILGTTRFGAAVDREVGTVPHGQGQMAYARYNVSFDPHDPWLPERLARLPDGKTLVSRYQSVSKLGPKKLSQMNTMAHFDQLHELGDLAGHLVDIPRHFQGFVPKAE
jgi:predicted acylesterase/phospholipase RssA